MLTTGMPPGDRATVVVVVFDALRPDMASAELMPNLHRFRRLGTTLANARAVFPTDTRANVGSLMTGVYPDRHGIMGNAWFDPAVYPDRPFVTADAAEVERADAVLGGRLFEVPTLGHLLAQAGRDMAVISTASSGTTRLIHHTVRAEPTHLCLHCHEAAACSPAGLADEAVRRFGPLPPVEKPDLAAVTYAVDAFLGWIWPERQPDLTVLWLNEPDTSYHWFGPGSAQAQGAIRHCDAQFGRILDWWLAEGRAAGVQLLTLSDHGQIGAGAPVDVTATLAEAGLHPATTFADGADLMIVPGYPIRLYARERDGAVVRRAAAALRAQPWCGELFALADLPGTVPLASQRAGHARAPDLVLTLRHTAGPDANGMPGLCPVDRTSPFAGVHGGLSPQEAKCLAIFAGTRFREGTVVTESADAVDFLPTVLAALDLRAPATPDGKVIGAALAVGPEDRRGS